MSSAPIPASLSNQWLREAVIRLASQHAEVAKASPTTAAALKLTQSRVDQLAFTPSVETAGALEHLLEIAKQHGEDSDPDHEVGDLQDILRGVWKELTPYQRARVLRSPAVSQMVEGAGCEALATNASDIDDWEDVCKFYGLDTSFQYGPDQMLEYTNMYRLESAVTEPAPTAGYRFGRWLFDFACEPAGVQTIRVAFDVAKAKVIALQVLANGVSEWTDASPEQVADLQDALASDEFGFVMAPTNPGVFEWGLSMPTWAHNQIERMTAAAEQPAGQHGTSASNAGPGFARYLHGTWEHVFHAGRAANVVRLVYDRQEEEVVAMEVRCRGGWSFATTEEMEDVEDSLKNANEDAIVNPADYGLHASDTRPVWCAEEVRRLTERPTA